MFKPQLVVVAGLLALASLPLPTLGQPVGHGFDVGGFRAYPWLNFLLGYADNYYRSNDEIRDLGGLPPRGLWQSVVEPGVRLTALKGADSYNLSYFARIGNVFDSSADDFVDQKFGANGAWEFGLRNRLTADYQFWYWHDPRGAGSPVDSARANFTQAEPDKWNSNRALLTYSYGAPGARGRMDLRAGYLARQYTNNGQEYRDNDRPLAGATFYARVRPKVSLLLDANWEKVDYTNQVADAVSLDSDNLSVYTGVTWDATAKTTGTVKIGWLGKDFSANQRGDVSDFGWTAQVQYRPRTYSTFNLRTERTPAETTTGLADAVIVSLVDLDWVHYWKPLLYTRFGLFGSNDDYVGSPRVDHRYNASGGIFYQVRRWMEVGVDYTYETRQSDESLADYKNNIVLFSVRTAY